MTPIEIPASRGVHGPGETTMPSSLIAHRVDLVQSDLVVAPHHDIRAELAEKLIEIEGERVVVVDQQDHDWVSGDDGANARSSDSIRSASSIARIKAPIL